MLRVAIVLRSTEVNPELFWCVYIKGYLYAKKHWGGMQGPYIFWGCAQRVKDLCPEVLGNLKHSIAICVYG